MMKNSEMRQELKNYCNDRNHECNNCLLDWYKTGKRLKSNKAVKNCDFDSRDYTNNELKESYMLTIVAKKKAGKIQSKYIQKWKMPEELELLGSTCHQHDTI